MDRLFGMLMINTTLKAMVRTRTSPMADWEGFFMVVGAGSAQ
jgi:hypothetical protein